MDKIQSSFVVRAEPYRKAAISAVIFQSVLYGREARKKPVFTERHIGCWQFAISHDSKKV